MAFPVTSLGNIIIFALFACHITQPGTNPNNSIIIFGKFLHLKKLEEIVKADSLAIHSNVTMQFIKRDTDCQ